MDQELAVRMDVYIEAPPERVWAALVSEDAWRAWFNGRTEIEPRLGGRFRVEGLHGGKPYAFAGKVVTCDAPNEFAVTWIPDRTDWPFPGRHSLLRFRLEREGRGTRVRLSHQGFEQLPESHRFHEYEGFARGWNKDEELAWLKQFVESGARRFA